MIPFNFHHLYYFYVTARLGSVSRAAEEVRVSQPALSAQIRRLEGSLGQKLFQREGRRLALTEDGRTAYAYARDIFDTGREFLDALRDRSQKGRLRLQIGVTNSVPKAFAAALLRFVLDAAPAALVQLHEDTLDGLAAGLRAHAFDALLSDVPHHAPEDGIGHRLIGRVPIAFCAAPELAARLGRLPRGLDGAPLLLPTAHSGVRHAVLEFLAAHRVRPRVVAELQDVELIHRLALEGAGVAPLNRFSLQGGPWKRKLVVLPSAVRHDLHDTAYLITRTRKKPHPLVERLLADFRISA